MADDLMRYESMAREALRGVVRAALDKASHPDGLPGEHHFYITFLTNAEGVEIPARLRERYPQEMTIVIKRHYWDLSVTPDAFSVGLSFDGQPEQLRVPFRTISRFFDPVAPFGLEFDVAGRKPASEAAAAAVPTSEPSQAQDAADADDGADNVVRLDAFRKS